MQEFAIYNCYHNKSFSSFTAQVSWLFQHLLPYAINLCLSSYYGQQEKQFHGCTLFNLQPFLFFPSYFGFSLLRLPELAKQHYYCVIQNSLPSHLLQVCDLTKILKTKVR